MIYQHLQINFVELYTSLHAAGLFIIFGASERKFHNAKVTIVHKFFVSVSSIKIWGVIFGTYQQSVPL